MRKEYFMGNPRKRHASLVWIDDYFDDDETGGYRRPMVWWGRRMAPQFSKPDFARELGEALIAAADRAEQLHGNREKRGRKYTRLWKE